jgi:hypothetical protein
MVSIVADSVRGALRAIFQAPSQEGPSASGSLLFAVRTPHRGGRAPLTPKPVVRIEAEHRRCRGVVRFDRHLVSEYLSKAPASLRCMRETLRATSLLAATTSTSRPSPALQCQRSRMTAAGPGRSGISAT